MWTKLSSDYFNVKFGDLPKSDYGIDYLNIIDNYRIAPYMAIVNKKYNRDSLKGFDIRRDYTGILIDNDVCYNVFHDFNQVEVFDGVNFTEGKYYINRVCYLGNIDKTKPASQNPNVFKSQTRTTNTIKITLGWWPYVLVKYLIEVGSITVNDSPYIIKPSH